MIASPNQIITRHHPGRDKNGGHFADERFKFIFLYESRCILIQISLNFARMCPINDVSLLVLVTGWC